jgi:hypothetical protein
MPVSKNRKNHKKKVQQWKTEKINQLKKLKKEILTSMIKQESAENFVKGDGLKIKVKE